MFRKLKYKLRRMMYPKLVLNDISKTYFAIFRKILRNPKTILELHPSESTCVAKLGNTYIKLTDYFLLINIGDNSFITELVSNQSEKLIKFFHLHTDIKRKESEKKQEQKFIKLLKEHFEEL